jgi:hypothetical protein
MVADGRRATTLSRATWRSPDAPRDAKSLWRRPNVAHAASRRSGETPAILYGGGPVMSAPKVVPVIFPGNPFDAEVRDFFAKLADSSYWQTTTAEYGVGSLKVFPPFVPQGPAPDNDTITQWIADLAGAPPAGLPAPDANTIYAIVLPFGWDAASGACTTFGAYHSWTTTAAGQSVQFTANPVCASYIGLTGIDEQTFGLSHEIVESATDPTGQGYATVNWALAGWASAAEGWPSAETGDMCEFQPDVGYRDPQTGYLVTRIWSNRSLAAGHDPCLPLVSGSEPYFAANVVVEGGTQVEPFYYTHGLSLPPGTSITVPVVLSADAPAGEWQLSAVEKPNPHLNPDIYGELSFAWDRASGRAGDVRKLTITRALPPDGASPVFLRVAINSTLGAVTHTSWLVIGTD